MSVRPTHTSSAPFAPMSCAVDCSPCRWRRGKRPCNTKTNENAGPTPPSFLRRLNEPEDLGERGAFDRPPSAGEICPTTRRRRSRGCRDGQMGQVGSHDRAPVGSKGGKDSKGRRKAEIDNSRSYFAASSPIVESSFDPLPPLLPVCRPSPKRRRCADMRSCKNMPINGRGLLRYSAYRAPLPKNITATAADPA
jgi:hypothetical protein